MWTDHPTPAIHQSHPPPYLHLHRSSLRHCPAASPQPAPIASPASAATPSLASPHFPPVTLSPTLRHQRELSVVLRQWPSSHISLLLPHTISSIPTSSPSSRPYLPPSNSFATQTMSPASSPLSLSTMTFSPPHLHLQHGGVGRLHRPPGGAEVEQSLSPLQQ